MSELKINSLGTKRWRNERGLLHRENNPAIIHMDGKKLWFLDGKLHREDGPAIEYKNGAKSWYLNDIEYTEDKYKRKMRLIKLKSVLD